MYATDFVFDGQYLSDLGFIICDFNATNEPVIEEFGADVIFEKVSRNRGKNNSLISTKYESCITATFDICKNPDVYDEMEISSDEYRNLVRWLNRTDFLPFSIIDDEANKDTVYFNASFNIKKVKINEKLYGLELILETDKPFGYGEKRVYVYDITDTSRKYIVQDFSDEMGYICPDIVITCKQAGKLVIRNDFEKSEMVIDNCSVGEVITILGETQIITSSYNKHKIAKDFNFEFLKIGNSFENKINNISVSLPCKIEIKYYPIIKETV